MTRHQPLLVFLFSGMLQAFDKICHDNGKAEALDQSPGSPKMPFKGL